MKKRDKDKKNAVVISHTYFLILNQTAIYWLDSPYSAFLNKIISILLVINFRITVFGNNLTVLKCTPGHPSRLLLLISKPHAPLDFWKYSHLSLQLKKVYIFSEEYVQQMNAIKSKK